MKEVTAYPLCWLVAGDGWPALPVKVSHIYCLYLVVKDREREQLAHQKVCVEG